MADPKPINVKIFGKDFVSPRLAELRGKLQKFSDSMTKTGKKLSTRFTLPLVLAAGASVKFAMDLNESMAKVQTLIPNSGDRVVELKKNVQELAFETGVSTKDISAGLYDVIRSFGDTADTAAILRTSVLAAEAGFATTAEVINLTSEVTRQYEDSSAAAVAKVTDLAIRTTQLGKASFPELQASMGKVIPVAKSLGLSQEELFGVFATATGVVGDAGTVSGQFSKILNQMAAPTGLLLSLFKDQLKTTPELMIKQKGLAATLQIIAKEAKAVGVPLSQLIGGTKNSALAMALTGAQAGELVQKIDALKNSQGALMTASQIVNKGINRWGDTLKDLQTKLIVVGQTIGDTMLPYLGQMAEKMTPLLQYFMDFIRFHPGIVNIGLAIAGIVAAIGPLLIGLGGIAAAISSIAIAWEILNVLTGGSLLAIGLIIAAVVALGVIIYKNWDTIKDFFINVGTAIRDFFLNIFDFVGAKIDAFNQKVQAIRNKVLGLFGMAPSEAGGGLGAGQPMAGAAGAAQVAAEGGRNYVQTNNAAVSVKFENPPPGMKVKTASGGMNLDVFNGLAFP